jgi:hypothetical protein
MRNINFPETLVMPVVTPVTTIEAEDITVLEVDLNSEYLE